MRLQLKDFFKELGTITYDYFKWLLGYHLNLLGSFKNLFINLYYDTKLNIETIRREKKNILIKDAIHYEATNYNIIKIILNYLQLKKEDIFVDIGCGKGRALFFTASQYKIKRVIGIEADTKIFDIAKRNLKHLKSRKTSVFLYHSNATDFDFKDGTIFFMYHPFGPKTQKAVLDKIHRNIIKKNKKIRIVYVTPAYSFVYDEIPWLKFERALCKGYVQIWHSK